MNFYQELEKARDYLELAKRWKLTSDEIERGAIELSEILIHLADSVLSPKEKEDSQRRNQFIQHDPSKLFLTDLTDQFFRSKRSKRIVDQIRYLLTLYGMPKGSPLHERFKLFGFKLFGSLFPSLAVSYTQSLLNAEMHQYILETRSENLDRTLSTLKSQGASINVAQLGELTQTHLCADQFQQDIIMHLQHDNVDSVSIKLSSLTPYQNSSSYYEKKADILLRLKSIAKVALSHDTLIYFDMEHYDDVYLTCDIFKTLLDLPPFSQLNAGIVIQAYLPDASLIQEDIIEWSKLRVSKGAAPITMRIVKGANLMMEKVKASSHHQPLSTFDTKIDVDAHFKHMLNVAFRPSNAHAVRVGVGTHNIFDIAYALLLRSERGVEHYVSFEMLYGMANNIRKIVQILIDNVLVYCPVSNTKSQQNAIAYMIRRLDETTAKGHFLRSYHALQPGSPQWEDETQRFRQSIVRIPHIGSISDQFSIPHNTAPPIDSPFFNEPHTLWNHPSHIKKIDDVMTAVTELSHNDSNPIESIDLIKLNTASTKGLKQLAEHSVFDLAAIMYRIANLFRQNRQVLVSLIVKDAQKSFYEADLEVSESIDFIEYYRRQIIVLKETNGIQFSARGTVMISSPWNFPLAISVGGITAALLTGNSVLFKPSLRAERIGRTIVDLFYEAGISVEMLQFLVINDETADQIVSSSCVDVLLLTGSSKTAQTIMSQNPHLHVLAETGGKNTMIVTDMADKEQAIHDIVHSAFSYSGQKCSSLSLLILQDVLYDDPEFMGLLKQAAQGLISNLSTEGFTNLPPLMTPLNPYLVHTYNHLDGDETWLLNPKIINDNNNHYSAGIKLGITPESAFFKDECFGPVLGVMRANSLEMAIDFANASSYGLTAGLHSLDEREHVLWRDSIQAGNLYINRTITGAIVGRQPFGGIKRSSYGPSQKAGGPHYLIPFLHFNSTPDTDVNSVHLSELPSRIHEFFSSLMHHSPFNEDELEFFQRIAVNYNVWSQKLCTERVTEELLGEENTYKLRPYEPFVLRFSDEDSMEDQITLIIACLCLDMSVEISLDSLPNSHFLNNLNTSQFSVTQTIVETEYDMAKRISPYTRIRMIKSASEDLKRNINQSSSLLIDDAIQHHGRIELLHYIYEQTTSYSYHRYGHLGNKGLDES